MKGLILYKIRKIFLKVMKKLESYLVGFNENETMKVWKYLLDCVIRTINRRLVIVITYNKNTFSANNDIQKA